MIGAQPSHHRPVQDTWLLVYGRTAREPARPSCEPSAPATSTLGERTISEQLAHARIAAQMTHAELAEAAGLRAQDIRDIEDGTTRFPESASIETLAQTLGVRFVQ